MNQPQGPWPRKKPIWKRWRWELAYLLDHSRKWCWASLCTWAANGSSLRELPESRDVGMCRPGSRDFERCGACYCGKFRREDLS